MIRLWFGEHGHAYGGFDVSLAPAAAAGLIASSRVPIAAVMAVWYERTAGPAAAPRCGGPQRVTWGSRCIPSTGCLTGG